MSFRRLLMIAVAAAVMTTFGPAVTANADETPDENKTAKVDLPVFGKKWEPSSLTELRKKQLSVAELRQARALLKSDQRRARMERNAWIGYEPLRPNWNAVPMTRSYYGQQANSIRIYRYFP